LAEHDPDEDNADNEDEDEDAAELASTSEGVTGREGPSINGEEAEKAAVHQEQSQGMMRGKRNTSAAR